MTDFLRCETIVILHHEATSARRNSYKPTPEVTPYLPLCKTRRKTTQTAKHVYIVVMAQKNKKMKKWKSRITQINNNKNNTDNTGYTTKNSKPAELHQPLTSPYPPDMHTLKSIKHKLFFKKLKSRREHIRQDGHKNNFKS